MHFVVGGEEYKLDRNRVELVMKKIEPESIQKHLVELLGTKYPPKQVFAAITGRRRASFTTQEAVRVLTKLGFECREVGHRSEDIKTLTPLKTDETASLQGVSTEERIVALESGLATAHLAIAQLQRRIEILHAN